MRIYNIAFLSSFLLAGSTVNLALFNIPAYSQFFTSNTNSHLLSYQPEYNHKGSRCCEQTENIRQHILANNQTDENEEDTAHRGSGRKEKQSAFKQFLTAQDTQDTTEQEQAHRGSGRKEPS